MVNFGISQVWDEFVGFFLQLRVVIFEDNKGSNFEKGFEVFFGEVDGYGNNEIYQGVGGRGYLFVFLLFLFFGFRGLLESFGKFGVNKIESFGQVGSRDNVEVGVDSLKNRVMFLRKSGVVNVEENGEEVSGKCGIKVF